MNRVHGMLTRDGDGGLSIFEGVGIYFNEYNMSWYVNGDNTKLLDFGKWYVHDLELPDNYTFEDSMDNLDVSRNSCKHVYLLKWYRYIIRVNSRYLTSYDSNFEFSFHKERAVTFSRETIPEVIDDLSSSLSILYENIQAEAI